MFTLDGSVRRFAFVVALSLSAVACGASPDEEGFDETAEVEAELNARSARFETFRGFDGQSYFQLIAGNGQNVLRSEGYVSDSNARRGVAAVLRAGVDPASYDVKEARNGEFYFNIVAGNGEIVSSSELYVTKSNAQRGANTVRALIGAMVQPETAPAPREARFEIFKAVNGKPYFRLRAANGEIVLASQGYSSKGAALTGIESVKTNGIDTNRFERITGSDGEVRIRLRANNGRIIAVGESYVSASNAERAVSRISEILADGVPTIER